MFLFAISSPLGERVGVRGYEALLKEE